MELILLPKVIPFSSSVLFMGAAFAWLNRLASFITLPASTYLLSPRLFNEVWSPVFQNPLGKAFNASLLNWDLLMSMFPPKLPLGLINFGLTSPNSVVNNPASKFVPLKSSSAFLSKAKDPAPPNCPAWRASTKSAFVGFGYFPIHSLTPKFVLSAIPGHWGVNVSCAPESVL